MRITHLDPVTYARSPWKNGGGVTIDIAEERAAGSASGSWHGLIWRFGRTTISTPAPFSDLSGYDRCQVVVAGSGLVLDTPDGEVDLRQAFKPVRYRGEPPIASRLENGPVEVINLIADRTRAEIALVVLEAGASSEWRSGTHIIHAANGDARVQTDGASHEISDNHALQVDGAPLSITCTDGLIVVASIQLR